MKLIKKTSVTPISSATASVIDSLYSGSDQTTNAPSIRAVKAALNQTIYQATVTSSSSSSIYLNITAPELPTTPQEGQVINIYLSSLYTGYIVYLSINGGVASRLYDYSITSATSVSGSRPNIGGGTRPYTLIYLNGAWRITSSFSKIRQADMATDYFTFTQTDIAPPSTSMNYTASANGVVLVQTAVYNGQSITFKVDGTEVAKVQSSEGGGFTWIPVSIPLSSGQNITASSSNGSYAQITGARFFKFF